MNLSGFHNESCEQGMSNIPDKYFDLVIADPPYFSGPEKKKFYGKSTGFRGVKRAEYIELGTDDWKVPDESWYQEVCRVSKDQIIFGIIYYPFVASPGRFIWDKVNVGTSYSDCEIASVSQHDSVRIYKYMWNGMMQGKSMSQGHIMQGNKRLNEKRIHQCQKPVNLYLHMLQRYAKEGDKILLTHVGSASDIIACETLGYDYLGFEINEVVFRKASNRLEQFRNHRKANPTFDF